MKAKFVYENINFERGKDPKVSLKIGVKNEIIDWIEERRKLSNAGMQSKYTINPDLTIDIEGFLPLTGTLTGITNGNLPKFINFRNVIGNFNISDNRMTDLRGCPKYVSVDFDCSRNHLLNLIGGPEIVDGDYIASLTDLRWLDGIATEIGGRFISVNNNMEGYKGKKFLQSAIRILSNVKKEIRV